jgi:ribosomal protein L37E
MDEDKKNYGEEEEMEGNVNLICWNCGRPSYKRFNKCSDCGEKQ